MRNALLIFLRQFVLVGLAVLAYFGVRGLTERDIGVANRNAAWLLDAERLTGLDIELGIQTGLLEHPNLVDLANWIYIWGHWPVIVTTLLWLVFTHRDEYYELRNAMFISGAIGMVIFALFPVAPPRLFGTEYLDTVTQRSESYRVLQPPDLINKYAALPSLHFGWNLLVGLTWRRMGRGPISWILAATMPAAMAFAVVATANHWVLDVFVGALVALAGLSLERLRRHHVRHGESRSDDGRDETPDSES